jgi:glycosyltransferase involved in cell wall biosynthesis
MKEHRTTDSCTQKTAAPGRKDECPRVIIGATVLGLGGIRTHLTLLCQLLRQQGVEVVVFATGSHWDPGTLANLHKLGVKFWLPPSLMRTSRKLSTFYCCITWPFLMPRRANSLYCISAGYSQILLHRLRPTGTLSVNHEIVVPPSPESPAGQCAARLDVTVANSRKVADLMQGFWPKKPIRVIPFLTSDVPTSPPIRRRVVGADGRLRVVYLGRLVEQKRPDQLVRRWPELSAQAGLAPARLEVFGYDPDGKMLRDLREFVAGSDLSQTIEIHGEYGLADLPRILDEADLVVLPSLWEGLPLVLVEAMLKGVPFVATAAGGTGELGENNPDVLVTGMDWADFEAGLIAMAGKIRSGSIDPLRLHAWAETRYGYAAVSKQWLACLCQPREFFNLP